MTNPQTDLVTSGDAAEIVGINLAAFRQRWKRRTLGVEPAALHAGHYLWNLSDIEKYAAQEAAR